MGRCRARQLKRNWNIDWKDEELLQFNFGLQNGRKGLEFVVFTFSRPRLILESGHITPFWLALLGVEKVSFTKTLVLSAAYKYSPAEAPNFFLMDFKGGTAFNPLKELPHVTGVVTNLNPLLVERALASINPSSRKGKIFLLECLQRIYGSITLCFRDFHAPSFAGT